MAWFEDLRDKVVVVTGASSGIGRATALAFGGTGARVVLVSRRRDALEEVADEIRQGAGESRPPTSPSAVRYARRCS